MSWCGVCTFHYGAALNTRPPFQVNFAPYFIAPEGQATLGAVADHVEHLGSVAGRNQCVDSVHCIAIPPNSDSRLVWE